MTVAEIKNRLNTLPFETISLGYSEFHFVKSENFDEHQIGYRIDQSGKSLLGTNGDWQTEWYVIAWDELGDPHFFDTVKNCVYTGIHGVGIWEPICIAESFDNYEKIIRAINDIAIGREYPVALEKNPIPIQEKEMFIKLITKDNSNSDYLYWMLKIGEEE